MAILSFAHLKNKKGPEEEKQPAASFSGPGEIAAGYTKPVMSFAHLKAKTSSKKTPSVDKASIKAPTPPRLSRIPVVMGTALLVATNYCSGCGRFGQASKQEQAMGIAYGMCLRSIATDAEGRTETWKVIPANATVSRCVF